MGALVYHPNRSVVPGRPFVPDEPPSGGSSSVRTADLPAAWRAAIEFCPYCSGDGCKVCRYTGDLMRTILEDAYEQGREAGVERMREVYRSLVFAGKTVSEAPVPPDLKQRM